MAWRTKQELIKQGLKYKTRKGLYRNKALYMALYSRGFLQEVYAKAPYKTKDRFSKGIPLYGKLIGEALQFESVKDMMRTKKQIYVAGRRNGIDFKEVIENRNNPAYLRQVLKDLFNQKVLDKK